MVGPIMNPINDLAIIGGGIVGSWVLYLAQQRQPNWRIVLIDRFRVAAGATAHSAGVLVETGRSENERRMAARSAALYREFTRSQGLITTCSEVYWVISREHVDNLTASAVDFRVNPVAVAATELRDRLAVPLHTEESEVILQGGKAISHDPGCIARKLISCSLQSALVRCVEGVAVTRAQRIGQIWQLHLDNGRQIDAACVISCVGPWLVESPFQAFAKEHAIRTKRVVALHVDRVPPPNAAALFFPQKDAYLMPLPARNQWLFSFRATGWDCRPERSQLDISAEDIALATCILDDYQPGLADHFQGGRAFCDAYVPTGEPLVAGDQGQSLVVAGAGSGAGFRFAPAIADEALRIAKRKS